MNELDKGWANKSIDFLFYSVHILKFFSINMFHRDMSLQYSGVEILRLYDW